VTRDEAQATVVRILGDIAPEMDPATLAFDVDLRDQLDIDSMDFLTLVIAVHEQTGVDIPERDYPKLATLDQIVDYVAVGASG
jgi:acyl carrier protein